MSYFDLQIIVSELQSQITNYRLANIYDLLNSSGFLLKFAIPDSKKLLIVNPGFQIHLTDFTRDTTLTPGNYVVKLRKHLKTRRVNRVALAKNDRVMVISFSDNHAFHLVFEFFAGGNMILLDDQFKILALLKTVSRDKTSLAPTDRYAIGATYDIDALLLKDTESESISPTVIKQWVADIDHSSQKKRKNKALILSNFLYTKLPHLSSALLEEHLVKSEVDPTQVVTSLDLSEPSLQKVSDGINAAIKTSQELLSAQVVPGYIVTEKNPQFTGTSSDATEFVEPVPITQAGTFVDPRNIEFIYTDYQPFKPTTSNTPLVKLESFNKTVDYYYSTIEASKASLKVMSKEQTLERRLQAARQEKDKRLEGLTEVQKRNQHLGEALQAHSDAVEAAAKAVRDLIDQKMDWKDMEQLIKAEQARNNPVAKLIALPLNLKENKIKVVLPDPDFEGGSDSESESESDSESDSGTDDEPEKGDSKVKRMVKVEIDLGLSAWANSRVYFDHKRTAAAKQERTLQSANKALKSAEHKIMRDMAASRSQDSQFHGLRTIREQYWFEKFYWFVSSDGYLVMGGRDPMQNQLLFRRYFKQNDVLVTADVTGASIVIIKNHLPVSEVPPSTISQAGAFAAASSKAWESKAIPRSWYGRFDQIDKVTKEGQLVPIDNIEVRGGRNVIPPMPMDMGLGFMWLLKGNANDDENEEKILIGDVITKHQGDKQDDSEEEDGLGSSETGREIKVTDQQESDIDGNTDSTSDSDSDSDFDDDFFPDTKLPDSVQSVIPHDERMNEDEEPVPNSSKLAPDDSTSIMQDSGFAEDSIKKLSVESKKRLSAKERRDLRKKKQDKFGEDHDNNEESSDDENDSSSVVFDIEKRMEMLSGSSKKKTSESSQQLPKVRGKKGKLKKIASKYADQEEEERRENLEKLGTLKPEGANKSKKQKEEEVRERQKLYEAQRKERQKRAEEAELKKIMDFDENEDLSALPLPSQIFVNKLKPGDVAAAAVPTFGAWGAISKLKYKIKFQPGTIKKGKAIKDIVYNILQAKVDSTAQDPDYAWPVEISLIKGLNPNEIAMPIAVSKVSFNLPSVLGGKSSDAKSSKGGSKGPKGGPKGKSKGGKKK